MPRSIKINNTTWDIEHYRRIERYAAMIDGIYNNAIKEASQIAGSINYNPNRLFAFASYPQTQERVRKMLSTLARDMNIVISEGSKGEWLQSAKKNDEFVDYIFRNTSLKKEDILKYYQPNLNALSAFQKRKINGLGLSDRVWNFSKQFKREIELGLDIGLGEGRNSQQLSRDLRSYLKEPDKLFRRVRDKRGNLSLSKVAKAYHPGQGVYRSSYKNALRLTRNEINMAYRTADHERWKQLDFVVGVEVRLSNQHKIFDICDYLKGKYPKDFKFVGWHPQCLCHAIPVLATVEEMDQLALKNINEESTSNFQSVNSVSNVPNGFNKWINDNQDRIEKWKSMPYFLRDNKEYV